MRCASEQRWLFTVIPTIMLSVQIFFTALKQKPHTPLSQGGLRRLHPFHMPINLSSIAESFPDVDFFSLADRSKHTIDVSASDDVFLSAKQGRNGAMFRRIIWDDGVTSLSRIVSKDDFDMLKSEHVKVSRSGGGENRSYRVSKKPRESSRRKATKPPHRKPPRSSHRKPTKSTRCKHRSDKAQSEVSNSKRKKCRSKKHTGNTSHRKKTRACEKVPGKKIRKSRRNK